MDDGPHDEADICFDMIIVVELYSELNKYYSTVAYTPMSLKSN